ncbi:MAG: CapA family protein [Clostridia bacterium]|nr:CapA family protein [Oscillospiraceae bacterium]MBQ7033806.1 CapA family protein [Clostridia bacterium]
MRKKYIRLAAVGILCLLLSGCTHKEAAPAVAVATPVPTPIASQIVLSAAGDCTLGSDPAFSYAGSFHARFAEEGENYAYFFENVADIFRADSFTFVNFEGTLTEETKRADKTYTFKGPAAYAKILSAGDIEVVSLSNNHTYDFGETGFQDTKAALSEENIAYAYSDKTVLLSVRPGEEAVPASGEKRENETYIGIAAFSVWYDGADVRANIKEAITELRNKGADLVFVSCHWGLEGENYPYEVQKSVGHYAIDAGADGVWGHHPHVIQGIETYKGKEIVYSMGNFCFGGNHNPRDKDCFIYQMTFETVDGVLTGKWESEILPCRISSQSGYNDYKPTPCEGAEKERILSRMEEYKVK